MLPCLYALISKHFFGSYFSKRLKAFFKANELPFDYAPIFVCTRKQRLFWSISQNCLKAFFKANELPFDYAPMFVCTNKQTLFWFLFLKTV